MSTIITTGASTIAPTVLLGYEANRDAGNIVHPILGSTNPDVTLRPAMLRSGRLELGFSGGTAGATSKTAADLLSTAVTFALTDTDQSTAAMNFVVTGAITRTLEDITRNAWLVAFEFQEIT